MHTGNTLLRADSEGRSAVHPRAYGEHLANPSALTGPTGSSPCIRGTRPVYRFNDYISAVHPRAYGEHSNHNRLNL